MFWLQFPVQSVVTKRELIDQKPLSGLPYIVGVDLFNWGEDEIRH